MIFFLKVVLVDIILGVIVRNKEISEFIKHDKCELCGAINDLTKHHLIPKVKSKKNKYRESKDETVVLCSMCHSTIHALFSESELRDNLNTLEKIIQNMNMHKYLLWRMNHLDFRSSSTKMSNRKK